MKCRWILASVLLVTVAGLSDARAQSAFTLPIDVNQPKATVSPTLYGLMPEEINYSYDDGLYAELIRNRTFRSDWTGILNCDHTLDSSVSGGDKFVYSATGSASKVCLKLVNATSIDRPMTIALRGIGTAARTADVSTLHGNTIWATNTIKDPKRIVPVSSTVNIKGDTMPYSVPAYSIQVLEIELK